MSLQESGVSSLEWIVCYAKRRELKLEVSSYIYGTACLPASERTIQGQLLSHESFCIHCNIKRSVHVIRGSQTWQLAQAVKKKGHVFERNLF
jgi:hypothetical protein